MKCDIDECEKEASHTFVWPWGTPSACCTRHIVVVQQKARAARGRMGQVNFVALDPGRPVEITRDERISLQSLRLTAEAERDDAQARAQKLFEANTSANAELRALRARISQYEANARRDSAELQQALVERDATLTAMGRLRETAAALGIELEDEAPRTPRDGADHRVGSEQPKP